MGPVTVKTVRDKSDLMDFISFPWRIYERDPAWAPPLKRDMKKLLDDNAHPFWLSAERELFLAYREGVVVGRIAAIEDRNYIEYWSDPTGAWGFFECIDSQEVANALFSAAEEWCLNNNLRRMHGPFNPSTNYECGMLTQGFGERPVLMMPYNPEYYLLLVAGCGYSKEKDLLAFKFAREEYDVSNRTHRIAQKLRKRSAITIRHGKKKDIKNEIAIISEIYQASWAENWGFVPMSDKEIDEMANNLVPILDERFLFFLCVDDEPIGFGLILPDVNPLLQRFDGKLNLLTPFKYLMYKSEIKGLRCLLFGIKPEWQRKGGPIIALDYIIDICNKCEEYDYLEASWTLEDNHDINNAIIEFGGREYRRYRIFEKSLSA